MHLIVLFRHLDENGFMKTKLNSRNTNTNKYLIMIREAWACVQNQEFERLGLPFRVSAESLIAQGKYREASKYMSISPFEMERRGIKTLSGNRYRDQVERVGKSQNITLSQACLIESAHRIEI